MKTTSLITAACLSLASAVVAGDPPTTASFAANNVSETAEEGFSLVFSDDFSTDPNTNGQWDIHRYWDNPAIEAKWDASAQLWHLTRAANYCAVAVYANYELTATEWKAEFRYRVGNLGGEGGGGDGFVFMFYKDTSYGRPAWGQWIGFNQYYAIPVAGYGLAFDNHYDPSCDPTPNNHTEIMRPDLCSCDPTPNPHIKIVRNNLCNSLVFREDTRTGDGFWHTVLFRYKNGKIKVYIDDAFVLYTHLSDPDYTYTGIGFGSATSDAVADHQIDNFRLWVRTE